jgi:hypothetical protein
MSRSVRCPSSSGRTAAPADQRRAGQQRERSGHRLLAQRGDRPDQDGEAGHDPRADHEQVGDVARGPAAEQHDRGDVGRCQPDQGQRGGGR